MPAGRERALIIIMTITHIINNYYNQRKRKRWKDVEQLVLYSMELVTAAILPKSYLRSTVFVNDTEIALEKHLVI